MRLRHSRRICHARDVSYEISESICRRHLLCSRDRGAEFRRRDCSVGSVNACRAVSAGKRSQIRVSDGPDGCRPVLTQGQRFSQSASQGERRDDGTASRCLETPGDDQLRNPQQNDSNRWSARKASINDPVKHIDLETFNVTVQFVDRSTEVIEFTKSIIIFERLDEQGRFIVSIGVAKDGRCLYRRWRSFRQTSKGHPREKRPAENRRPEGSER